MRITARIITDKAIRDNIQNYLDEHNLNQEVIAVTHDKSDPDYIYMVMTKDTKDSKYYVGYDYHVYTCWNESTQCLNYGEHQVSEQVATEILMGGYARKREMYDNKPNEIRIEELCTKFKDEIESLRWMEYEDAMGFFRDECELTENECEWLGIKYDEMMRFDEEDEEDDE